MQIDVPPHGFVKLVDHMASDLAVVNSARVSFAKHKEVIDDSDIGLIKFLYKNNHATPFESSVFRFHIKAPIFVIREWMRTRFASYNEMSMRYHVPDKLEFHLPAEFRTQVGKPGAYTFESIESNKTAHIGLLLKQHYERCEELYKYLIEFGIAKEQAREVLPVSVYSEFYWTVNARSLLNFLSLRNHSSALKEIRDFANALENIFKKYMPITHEAFLEHDRNAFE